MITVTQHLSLKPGQWERTSSQDAQVAPQLIYVFGSKERIADPATYTEVRGLYPAGDIILASTSGEIIGTHVYDGSVTVTACHFEKTSVRVVHTSISGQDESAQKAEELARTLVADDLKHVLVFTDGLLVNGSQCALGMAKALPQHVAVTGGLAGDGAAFVSTAVGHNGPGATGAIVMVGFYGSSLKIGYGSVGGWDPFGPDRVITRSKGNVLYELDHEPALALYKKYLGEKAAELPSSGLLFPLELTVPTPDGRSEQLVRTLLAVHESDQSMTFAGDMPEGISARMMRANFERLVDGADGAARRGVTGAQAIIKPQYALLVSCVGRKLVLGERVEDEVEAIAAVVGTGTPLTGFYSYGELCPTTDATNAHGICQLHNQTMTITTFEEA
jgi:hypothetical protein